MSIAWQILLVSNMMGMESHLANEAVTMVTDLLALDVPIGYSSMPSIVAAITSGIILVSLSFVGQKYATSTAGKALLLVLVNVIHFAGATLIITGNLIKLMYYNDLSSVDLKNNPTSPPDILENYVNALNFNSSSYLKTLDTMTSVAESNFSNDSLSLDDASGGSTDSFLPFPFYAALVIVGYALAESGFDAGNCFLKIYILACSSSDIHSSVLIKSVLMGSFGGLSITLLGSLGIGEWLTAGTQYNVDVVNTMFITSVALIISIVTLSVSLISGMAACCNSRPIPQAEPVDESIGYEITTGEKKNLLTRNLYHKPNEAETQLTPYEATSKCPSTKECSHSNKDDARTLEQPKSFSIKELVQSFRQRKVRIYICAATLFACFTVFSFSMYSVNFVGVAIYDGDSSAPDTSEAYTNFLNGERAGSTGLLLVYLSYTAFGFFQKSLLDKFGWWHEVALMSTVFIVINFCCAYYLQLWLYYAASCMTGLYRVLIYTVPYLLILKTSENEQADQKSSKKNLDIALITSLWPFSFLVAACITGPFLSWTGNAATSMYMTAAAATISLMYYFLVREV